jgi:two-component system NtrC family sensor kinase
MRNMFRHPSKSLAMKLILAIGVLMVIGSIVFWYAILQKQQKDILSIASKYGNSFVDFVKKRTHNNMLTLQRTEIQQTLEDLSIAEGVERVQIFNHEGEIIYSSEKENVNSFIEKDSLACKGCHLDTEETFQLLREPITLEIYKNPERNTSLKLIEPIYNESSCFTAKCHVHPKKQKILGFIESNMSLELLDEATLKQGLALTAYVIVFITAISLALGIILYKIVSKPVSDLTNGMDKVALGNLDYSVPIQSRDEMGMLATTFNSMIKDIKAARDQRERWTQTLEEEVRKKAEEIQKTHASLVQTEKLASLGRMAAGVAHEINNPLTGIVTFAHLMKNNVPADSSEAEDLNIIIEQAERCAKIIKNLLTFARVTPSEKGDVNINDLLNRTIYMVSNQAKFHNIKFDINLDESQLVTLGDASQFQQIFLNMFINASDAMNKRGTISVVTRIVPVDNRNFVEIEFTDTGTGISEEILGKLFEPFFTTKPVGKGTGLGLSVSHGIVKHYGGHIDVRSTVGKGTSFFVRLPLIEQTH